MKAEWLANVDGQEYGPFTWQQMLQMAAEGRVPAELPVKRVQDKKWYKAAQVPGLLAPAKTASAAATPAASAKKKDDSSHLKRAKPLQATARERRNVFASLMEAVKTHSLGQISHALYDVGGEYRRNM